MAQDVNTTNQRDMKLGSIYCTYLSCACLTLGSGFGLCILYVGVSLFVLNSGRFQPDSMDG